MNISTSTSSFLVLDDFGMENTGSKNMESALAVTDTTELNSKPPCRHDTKGLFNLLGGEIFNP
jgi:hypothetical protein